MLLKTAEEAGVRVNLLVRLILWQSDFTPAYLEFRSLEKSVSLRHALRLLIDPAS
jgi:hypothetical protein